MNAIFVFLLCSDRKKTKAQKNVIVVAGCSMEDHQLWVKHEQIGIEGLYYSRLLYSPYKMLIAQVLSQHRVSPPRTIKLRTPCHAQYRLWAKLLERDLRFIPWHCTRNPLKERNFIVHGRMESHNPNCHTSFIIILIMTMYFIPVESNSKF